MQKREKRLAKEAKRIASGAAAEDEAVISNEDVGGAEAENFIKIDKINKELSVAVDKLMEEDGIEEEQPSAAEAAGVKEASEGAGLKDEYSDAGS